MFYDVFSAEVAGAGEELGVASGVELEPQVTAAASGCRAPHPV